MRKSFCFLFLLFLSFACSTDSGEVTIRLTMEEREQLDKRVSAHMDSLRPVLDSLCTTSFADRVAIMTDSIVQRRLEEEVRLRARIPQNLRER
jgi:hypothetical protein